MWWLAIGLCAVLAACTQSLQDEAFNVCHPLCRCAFVLPGEQDACTDTCMADFARNPVSEACSQCVVEHAGRCLTLSADCVPVCTRAAPLAPLLAGDDPESRIAR